MTASSRQPDIDTCLCGDALYGDDFTGPELTQWYEDETSAYGDIWGEALAEQGYGYHALNRRHGFAWLPAGRFATALAFGCADGAELAPLTGRVGRVHAVEPDERFHGRRLVGAETTWHRPAIDGHLPFADASFQLVTALGALHHVANVSTVLGELRRCLTSGGYALLRDPVISMGDWRQPRPGLTRNERGLPLPWLRRTLTELGFEVVHQALCLHGLTNLIARKAGRPIFANRAVVLVDDLLSRVTSSRLTYHATTPAQKLRPTNVFLVLRAQPFGRLDEMR
jgi:SAM-dependent methyltransferase